MPKPSKNSSISSILERLAKVEEAIDDLRRWMMVVVGLGSTTIAGITIQLFIKQ